MTAQGFLQRVRETVAKSGWAVVPVVPTSDRQIMLSYTVGMTTRGLPELVITGLEPLTAGELLNKLARRLVDNRLWKAGDQVREQMPSGFTYLLRLDPVDDDRRATAGAAAHRLYGPDKVQLLQVVWPDRHGHYPGSTFYSLPLAAQPLLRRGGHG